jgi:uncharacterized OB-fold protein
MTLQGYRCGGCGYRSTVLKALCPQCGAAGPMTTDRAAAGRILDFVPVLFPPENLKDLGRYVSVLVELDNGCRAFGVFRGDPTALAVGAPVTVGSVDAERGIPFFDAAGAGGGRA